MISLTETESHHKTGIEPYTLHDDIGGDEIANKIFFAVGAFNIQFVVHHSLHVFVYVGFFGLHGRHAEMKAKDFLAVKRKSFQNVFKSHTVVGFFPHLLGQIEMALGRFEIRINTESDGAVDDELGRIEKGHEKFHGVFLVLRHFRPVVQVLFEGYLVGKPGVSDGLIIEVISPLVSQRVQADIFW